MAGKRVLLAGAGDLCQRAARLLLAQGDEVWGLRRHPPPNDAGGIQWLSGDLTQKLDMLPTGITHIVYAPTPNASHDKLAAGAPSPETRTRPNEAAYRAVFLHGLQNLVAVLDRQTLQRFLFISSGAVYGACGDVWVDEATAPNPDHFNGQVLLEAEQWLAAELANATCLRLAGLYGPGRLALLERLKEGRALVPRHTIHWANRFHIDDAARAAVHLLGLDQPEACYIGADNHPHRIDELYDTLAAMLNVDLPPAAAPSNKPGNKRLCNARLRASGFEPAWPDAIEGYRVLIGGAR
ncbi:MAG: NAD-dependent epimerase/dehydratase family protein [Paralcaligenes sp.]